MKEFKRSMERRVFKSLSFGYMYKAKHDSDVLQHCAIVGKKFPRSFYGRQGRHRQLWIGPRFWEKRYDREKTCGQ